VDESNKLNTVCLFCKTSLNEQGICPNGECVLSQGQIKQFDLDAETVRGFLSPEEQASVLSSSQAALEILGSIAQAQNTMTEQIGNITQALRAGFQTIGTENRIIVHALMSKGILTKEDLDQA